MSGNAEASPVDDCQFPGATYLSTINQPINLSSGEGASQVDWLGTALISEDWGDDSFDSEDDALAKKNMMVAKSGAKSFLVRIKWKLKVAMNVR